MFPAKIIAAENHLKIHRKQRGRYTAGRQPRIMMDAQLVRLGNLP